MEMSTPKSLIMQETTVTDETPVTCASRNGFLQNAVGQDLVHLGVARTTSAGHTAVSNAVNTEHQRITIDLDPASSSAEHFKTPELVKESGLQEDEKGEANMYDERQPRRRKRTIMNDEQINEIEKALVDEPEMQKNTTLLQAWSEKLSLQVFSS
jgi:cellulose biosynthesis protein BcsQ